MIPTDLVFWLTQVLNGLVLGVLLLLITLGLTIIFGIVGVVNFAHGSLYMLGAYFAISIIAATGNFWVGLIGAPLLVGAVGIVMERAVIRPVRKHPSIFTLLLTFGVALVLDEAVKIFWGALPYSIAAPSALSGTIRLIGLPYPVYRLFILGFGLGVTALLFLFLEKTDLGVVVRAASADSEMLEVMGINTSRLFMWVFALGSALAALGGVVAGPLLTVYPGMGVGIIIEAFVVLVLGGLGSLRGAIMAAALVSQVQALGAAVISEYALGIVFAMMAAILLLRPRGLLGQGRLD